MSGFLARITDTFTEGGRARDKRTPGTTLYSKYYGGQTGPSPPPYPWIARWDDSERRYLYINEQTGERSWEFPHSWGGARSSFGYRNEYGALDQIYQETQHFQQREPSRGLAWGLGGAAVGLGAGALLVHEGSEIKRDWEEDESRVDNGVNNSLDIAAEWTGRKIGKVESLPEGVEQGFDRFGDRVEQKWDSTVEDVEAAPESTADWVGEKVGDVEDFGDGVDSSHDEGKYEGWKEVN